MGVPVEPALGGRSSAQVGLGRGEVLALVVLEAVEVMVQLMVGRLGDRQVPRGQRPAGGRAESRRCGTCPTVLAQYAGTGAAAAAGVAVVLRAAGPGGWPLAQPAASRTTPTVTRLATAAQR